MFSNTVDRLESGTRTGWLVNYHSTTLQRTGSGLFETVAYGDRQQQQQQPSTGGRQAANQNRSRQGGNAESGKGDPVREEEAGGNNQFSALHLRFMDLDGQLFECDLRFNPYFFVASAEGHERDVELGIISAFGTTVANVERVEKEDLGMINHLSGKRRCFLKLSFRNTSDLTNVRSQLEAAAKRHQTTLNESLACADVDLFNAMSPESGMDDAVRRQAVSDKRAWMAWVTDLREYDVKYFTRIAIDLAVFVGVWYDIEVLTGQQDVVLHRCDDSKYAPAMPRICAFDIETTKAPLKFPQPETDQIYMLSYMIDIKGYLIVNREIVTADIRDFEYSPTKEYEGVFEVFNEPDEAALLRRFYDEMQLHKPMVFVTYNGDYFDFPFIHARSLHHGMNMRKELGFGQNQEGATLNQIIPHLDCFYWVKRDSYLPQGSQGLKAVTKAKLGYEPIEVDPEEMLPLAQSHPERMASYSVSDAVSTYYLYMKYVHPFIFSLCTIIPMPPDDVLRKGSGTLCESLLMVQAYHKKVIFPNKQQARLERYHDGHLLESETYIGGRVEALVSGVYRRDIPLEFRCEPEAFTMLANRLDDMLKFALEEESETPLATVTNYDAVKQEILKKLYDLRDRPNRMETPLIYHLDVAAMYPNIILTNRLQPPSMVTPDICAGCCFNTPDNSNDCKRTLDWQWRGELFTAGRHEVARIKSQLETEAFQNAAIAYAEKAATTKKAYGNRRGNVLEGTSYERKPGGFGRGGGGGGRGAGGYRSGMKQRDEMEGRLQQPKERGSDDDAGSGGSGADSDDEGTSRHFNKLNDTTQFALLKKRLGEYCRKAYRKTHESREILKTHTVCQRENSFYVDTVRLFRDRRYYYKREHKKWKDNLDKATDLSAIKEAKSRVVQMESLQLAHKCILNSFYGYVMRKGSRWYSMEMAGIVTYTGAGLIMIARQLVQQIGVTLELDTDGIWCCLPASFPENFTITTNNPKNPKATIS